MAGFGAASGDDGSGSAPGEGMNGVDKAEEGPAAGYGVGQLLIPPLNFAMVTPGVYRSGAFLRTRVLNPVGFFVFFLLCGTDRHAVVVCALWLPARSCKGVGLCRVAGRVAQPLGRPMFWRRLGSYWRRPVQQQSTECLWLGA